MRRDRLPTIVGVATILLVVWALPASGHATSPGATTYPSDTDQQLTLDVPDERGEAIHNTGVSVFTPAGWNPLACTAMTSWSCQVITAGNQLPEVRWTKDAGAAPGPNDETFVFTVHTGPPGKAAFPVTQTYSNGEVVRWIDDDPDADEPAPVFEAVASAVTSTSGAPTTTTTHAVPSTAAPTTRTAGSPTTAAEAAAGDDGGSGSPLVVVALVAALAGLAGGGVWFVRKRR